MTTPLLLALPWLLFGVAFVLLVRLPWPLPPARGEAAEDGALPLVSVVVPARNESHNIVRVLESLTRARYPDFEILVVDDRSEDDTADLARGLPPGNARRLAVLDGRELPEGWLGKPWACHQGASEAEGDLLLFTDADTVHGPDLLTRAVAGMADDEADLLTVVGRQILGSFWERLVQPQVFVSMLLRYPDRRRPLPRERWRGAIANGQFLLFRREAYEAVGGHEAVRGAVAEDLKLAQRVVGAGMCLSLRRAEDDLGTRMYRSLGELVAGWSKNLLLGGLDTLPPGLLRAVTPVAMLFGGLAFWVAPPVLLAAALAGWGPAGLLPWAATATGVSMAFWAGITWRFGASPLYGTLYPLGHLVLAVIVARAWMRGSRVEWKGRSYRVGASDADGAAPHASPVLANALERWPELASRFARGAPMVFLDFDGTLAPIVEDPDEARPGAAMLNVLRRLAARVPTAVVSGRERSDVAARVGVEGVVYAGSHGFDIDGLAPGDGPSLQVGGGRIEPLIARTAETLRTATAAISGVRVEDKGWAVAVHYRQVDPARVPEVEAAVRAAAAGSDELRMTEGKKVFEVRPTVDWDKGRAVRWLLDAVEPGDRPRIPLYIGDDVTDEDAFLALGDSGVGIVVLRDPRPTAARYSLRDPGEVRAFLERLAELVEEGG